MSEFHELDHALLILNLALKNNEEAICFYKKVEQNQDDLAKIKMKGRSQGLKQAIDIIRNIKSLKLT